MGKTLQMLSLIASDRNSILEQFAGGLSPAGLRKSSATLVVVPLARKSLMFLTDLGKSKSIRSHPSVDSTCHMVRKVTLILSNNFVYIIVATLAMEQCNGVYSTGLRGDQLRNIQGTIWSSQLTKHWPVSIKRTAASISPPRHMKYSGTA